MAGLGSPCGACKFLRRKCVKGCIFAPYFCHEQGAEHFAAIHKVFGASNASKLLMHLPVSDRCEAAVTMSYEAQARLCDPIYGCVAHIFSLQQQVVNLQAQLESLKAQATQGYGDGSSISSPQRDNRGNMYTPCLQDEQAFFDPTMAIYSSVKNENQSCFANDHFASTSSQSLQGFEAELCMLDYSITNPCCAVQGSGYHDMEDLQDFRSNRAALFDGIEEGAIRSSAYSSQAHEHENDQSLDSLQDRVSVLKRLTGDIHEEVENHNRMLDRMGNDMDASRGFLSGTVDKFKMVFETKSSRRMATMVASFIAVFFLIYYLTK
ncbi:hypothetical protein ABZP36_027201 [Zizania latifolia]